MPLQNATLRVGRREIMAMVFGTLLYALISYLANFSQISAAENAVIRPAIAIPALFGLIFGPIVGFVTGMFGNLLNDALIYGLPQNPAALEQGNVIFAYYLNWAVGNGLLGLIPGILALYHRLYRSVPELLQAMIYAAVGIVVGVGFASLTDIWVAGATFNDILYFQFIPITQINVLNTVVIVPIVLYNYARLDLRATNWLQSKLLRRLVFAIILAAAVPTVLLGIFLWQETSDGDNSLLFRLAFVVLLTLFFTIVSAGLVAQNLLRPLIQLINAASQMQTGKLPRERATQLKDTPVEDEVSQLSSVFGKMAEQVIDREQSLKRQLESLKIEIDQTKQFKQVEEITDNEFFRGLQSKAKNLRQREKRNLVAEVDASLPVLETVSPSPMAVPVADAEPPRAPALTFIERSAEDTAQAVDTTQLLNDADDLAVQSPGNPRVSATSTGN